MFEFEIYLPVTGPENKQYTLQEIKDRVRERFGGYTYFPQESQGEWETGGQRFHDDIVILRVLTRDDDAFAWFQALRTELIEALQQEDFLITVKEVRRVEDRPGESPAADREPRQPA